MIREELEFRIAQYADGTLPASQRAALEAELAADGAARELLAQYRQLHQSAMRSGSAAAARGTVGRPGLPPVGRRVCRRGECGGGFGGKSHG